MFAKRLLDIFGATFGLLVLLPFFAAVSLVIRLDSKGPALFKQVRLGKDGEPFTIYKFRSMRVGAGDDIHRKYVTQLIEEGSSASKGGENGSYKIECDPRVSRIGRFLRRMSIDELPQLLNVLKGEMSLVGPRPPLPYEVEIYKPHHRRRLEVVPGITGLWQVSGRNQKNFDEMVALDITYIDNWSFWLDVKILCKTASAVLNKRGAW